jgi:hypothetical protein
MKVFGTQQPWNKQKAPSSFGRIVAGIANKKTAQYQDAINHWIRIKLRSTSNNGWKKITKTHPILKDKDVAQPKLFLRIGVLQNLMRTMRESSMKNHTLGMADHRGFLMKVRTLV